MQHYSFPTTAADMDAQRAAFTFTACTDHRYPGRYTEAFPGGVLRRTGTRGGTDTCAGQSGTFRLDPSTVIHLLLRPW